jgi:hypothetical protein
LLPHEVGTAHADRIAGMCAYCSRWRLPRNMPPTFQIMGEPAACWLNRNRAVSRTNLTAALRRDGSPALGDDAEDELERRLTEAAADGGGGGTSGGVARGQRSSSAPPPARDALQQQPGTHAGTHAGTAGLFMYVSHRHTSEYALCTRMLRLSAAHWLVRKGSVLMFVNKPSLETPLLLTYLRDFPMGGLKMLIKTDQNAGYRCGHLHAFVLSTHIWRRFPWVISFSGGDILLAPPAVVKLAAHLAPHVDATNVRALRLATSSARSDASSAGAGGGGGIGGGGGGGIGGGDGGAGGGGGNEGRGRHDFVMDIFNRYRFHVQTCMDAFAFRTRPLLAKRAWPSALTHCAGNAKEIAEGALHWMLIRHNVSTAVLGGRAGSCTSHKLGYGGIWHSGNITFATEWLERAEKEPAFAAHATRGADDAVTSTSATPAAASAASSRISWASKEMCWAAAHCPASSASRWATSC